ncbi:uncharacterized protein LOC129311637 [Prosopis cineraria]|uniref:uncharacterized protein LOC129311637 n=1 Tax=Prosopis cineraria TaxID=364024 RepID=UPI00240EF644|nr:uncharacterized protein LOC129311637 [Prosopis cineraria]
MAIGLHRTIIGLMNVDGAFATNQNIVGCGEFKATFMYKMNDRDPLHAELWACLWGLKMAWDFGTHKLILKFDPYDAVEAINGATFLNHTNFVVIYEIRDLLARD